MDENQTIVIDQVRCEYAAVDPSQKINHNADIIISKNINAPTGKIETQFLQSDWIKTPLAYPSFSCNHLERDKCIW